MTYAIIAVLFMLSVFSVWLSILVLFCYYQYRVIEETYGRKPKDFFDWLAETFGGCKKDDCKSWVSVG